MLEFGAPRTRSALLAARRAESANILQTNYNVWEAENPAWARRLTGPAAAAALGYTGEGNSNWTCRSEMIHARKTASRQQAMKASGFDMATQRKLTSHELDALNTSISRVTTDPSLKWNDAPDVKSRSQLRAERRSENVRTLDEATERNERDGVLGAEARVQKRIDQNIVYLQAAPVGQSRAELLASRRAERANAALSAYQAHTPQQPPKFADQPQPFWQLKRELGDGRKPAEYTTSTEFATTTSFQTAAKHAAKEASRINATLPPDAPEVQAANALAERTAALAHPAPTSSSTPELLPNGSQSVEMLRARQRWWSKPDVYPAVTPAVPRSEDPFKLASDDNSYLNRKLSSGPKRAQRGYPQETMQIAEKLTSMPPPSLLETVQDDPRMQPFRQYTGAAFKFMPSEPREVVPGQDAANFDGYEFTQPLYSSFTQDKTFAVPKLPPRPVPRNGRNGTAMRERTRPSTSTGGGRFGATQSTAVSGGAGSLDMSMRPVTAAMGSR